MASKNTSPLMELLKLLRRIVVLSVAAYGLAREMPYPTLFFRLAALWAVLYICSGIVDAVFRHLGYRATIKQHAENAESTESSSKERKTGTQKTAGQSNLPAVSAGQAR